MSFFLLKTTPARFVLSKSDCEHPKSTDLAQVDLVNLIVLGARRQLFDELILLEYCSRMTKWENGKLAHRQ